MNKKFTPGDWTLRKNRVFIGDTYKSIATVHVVKNYEDVTFKPIEDLEAKANARLISAAPELLEALITCWRSLETYQEHPIIKIKVDNALKKAGIL